MGPNQNAPAGTFFAEWARENAVATRRRDENPARYPEPDAPDGRRGRLRIVALCATVAATLAIGVLLPGSSALADPSANTWYRLRICESGNNYAINTGNDHYGAYQFDLATWRSVGGTGYPNRASKAEQDARALTLYRERGWQPWQCAAILGLREDADARSGRIGDIRVGTTTQPSAPTSSTAIPEFPGGNHWYAYGETNRDIKTFQDQMHRRGFFPLGTGEYGPNTLRMVKRLQQLNGLVPNGYIGPNTWRLAWIGKYAAPGAPVQAVPTFPGGAHWYVYGETNRDIKTFQDQMHRRGFFPLGTGEYGPNTLRMVKRLQQLNGLVPNGYIGPNTWRLAWTGKY